MVVQKVILQIITVSFRSFCDENGIIFGIEWIPREESHIADHLSRCRDSDDWSVSKSCFLFLDKLWGKHTVDRFSSHYNAHYNPQMVGSKHGGS